MNSIPLMELLDKDKFILRPTVGVSMEPLLHQNTTLVLIVKEFQTPKKGDVVLFERKDGSLILHRVVKATDSFFYIRGDNCYFNEKVVMSQIRGLVVQIYRNGKFFEVDNSFFYRLYTFYILTSYPFRFVLMKVKNKVRGALRRIKHLFGRFRNGR